MIKKRDRALIWLLELLSESILFSCLLIALMWGDISADKITRSAAFELAYLAVIQALCILFFLFTTGYTFTTAWFRIIWKPKSRWPYPSLAVVLFFLHFEILNLGVGGAYSPPVRLGFRIGGALIVLAVTFTGEYLLRRRSLTVSSLA